MKTLTMNLAAIVAVVAQDVTLGADRIDPTYVALIIALLNIIARFATKIREKK